MTTISQNMNIALLLYKIIPQEDYIFQVVLSTSFILLTSFTRKTTIFTKKIHPNGLYLQKSQVKLRKIRTIKHYLQRWIEDKQSAWNNPWILINSDNLFKKKPISLSKRGSVIWNKTRVSEKDKPFKIESPKSVIFEY